MALLRAGLKTVGELATRPMAAIAARFGGEAVDRAAPVAGRGGQADQAARSARRRSVAERRFAEPVARTEYALEVLGELAAEAARQLEQRAGRAGGGSRRSSSAATGWCGRSRSRPASRRRDPALVMRLIDERIEGSTDPIDPGFGFDLIRLAVPRRSSRWRRPS